ncbi:phage major capsid protein [Ligilactobacillus equi]|uniref:Phage capsid protein n=1 Tax=Ligilactobacillus equi DSM 15833 = JCM 10991 TaxID=1423740 RepID=A0A0R1T4T9_9LACO|nr:phage major capsid protein [Ligilactobacillus equi]KRL76621.1 phage capsid protein [Ligilactobacillus equi DSM 15833 = JCM 10991]
MNLEEKLKTVRAKLNELRSNQIAKRAELRSALENAETNEDLEATKAMRSAIEDITNEIKENEDLARSYEEALKGNPEPAKRKKGGEKMNLRSMFNEYLHTRDAASAGFKSTDGKVTIPEAVIYNPEDEVKTVTDLTKYVRVVQVTTASGSYPVLAKATAKMNTVAELEANPDLAKPKFQQVKWEVATRRGAIPLSQEAIDDSAIDLVGLVARDSKQQKVNTTNADISTVIKGFTAKETATLDDLKKVLNVDLDPAYNRMIVASQSFYNWLDTLKDKNGQYLLHPAVAEGSPAMILGVPVVIVEDTLLGQAGEAHGFVGDLERAVLFANRADLTFRWVENEIYGQYLSVATRYDVKATDQNAGYFVTVSEPGK